MAETTLEQMELLAEQLPREGKMKLLAHISQRLNAPNPAIEDPDHEIVRRERRARAEAIQVLCDAAADRFAGEANALEDIYQMRNERIEQICQSDA
jgi:hypothetical protein